MTEKNLKKIIRTEYKAIYNEARYWEKEYEKANHKKYQKDYYWASGREFLMAELADKLGVELFDENFDLIEEDE
jgi:hypothetical protein